MQAESKAGPPAEGGASDATDYEPPFGCGMLDVWRWRHLVGAARQLAAKPQGRVVGLGRIIKAARRAVMPFGQRRKDSAFARLYRCLAGFRTLDDLGRARAGLELLVLAEAVAVLLGDPADRTLAGFVLGQSQDGPQIGGEDGDTG
jgi:hypothetical protein